ncbi:hypothetical protein tb265_17400 [Gemmatimonadetes bacterium T265]|nr:hypothetical protein tb265_17400 [Gemmatimonadetes bacterium T265]
MVTLPLPAVPTSAPAAAAPAVVAALLDALRTEQRLVDDLAATMRRQRAAVGGDDLETVDDTVFATHRLLATLGQARLRRRQLGRLVAGSDDVPVRRLRERAAAAAVVDPGADALCAACDALLAGATALAREVDVNRRVLRDALAGGDAHARALRGLPAAGATGGAAAALVDRRA